MKKFLKFFAISVCSVASLLVISFVLVGLFGPVSVDVGPCSGGFDTYVADVCRDDIAAAAGETITDEEFETLYVGWGGRNLGAHFVNDKGEKIDVKGTRVWYGVYKWEKV